MRSTQVYRAADVVEGVLYPILTYQQELSEQHSGEVVFGTPLVPNDLPAIEPVKLETFTKQSTEVHKETVSAPVPEKSNFFWKTIVIVLPVLTVVSVALWLKCLKKRKM